ncbi:MAG: hypothetical protein IMF06_14395 [Proteobacteria bacterium]|nr:hypothetical protein [Pseudomonadota bacterium]
MNKWARKIHRWVSYIVFIQVTLWIIGGLAFAVIPFDSIVKSGSVMATPVSPALPENWAQQVQAQQQAFGPVVAMSSSNSSEGLLLKLQGKEESLWIRMSDGKPAVRPKAESVGRYAEQLYVGDGELLATRHLAESEYRYFGFVDELYGRVNVWQASFSDSLGSRLYFDGETGRYLTVRNDFWVFYDAMWRLHIMDYQGGEDFNNKLLLFFALFTFVFAISGLILTYTAIQRAVRKARA